jgi:lipopolysaccharide/colanic/teichoic acid biosynthesis glycosyltransferase
MGSGSALARRARLPRYRRRRRIVRAIIKRALDVGLSLVILPCVAPVMAVAALLIKLDSPGPILFSQERAGRGGRPFKMLKFRTMVKDAEALLEQDADIDSKMCELAFKHEDDPRVTRVGRVLRRWSIDELPQLVNVLRGEMSLVGPRPEESRIVARYPEWYRERLTAKPGLTGPMQVNGRGDLSFEVRAQLEIKYIKQHTLWRDFVILLRTIPAVIRGKGAY